MGLSGWFIFCLRQLFLSNRLNNQQAICSLFRVINYAANFLEKYKIYIYMHMCVCIHVYMYMWCMCIIYIFLIKLSFAKPFGFHISSLFCRAFFYHFPGDAWQFLATVLLMKPVWNILTVQTNILTVSIDEWFSRKNSFWSEIFSLDMSYKLWIKF